MGPHSSLLLFPKCFLITTSNQSRTLGSFRTSTSGAFERESKEERTKDGTPSLHALRDILKTVFAVSRNFVLDNEFVKQALDGKSAIGRVMREIKLEVVALA